LNSPHIRRVALASFLKHCPQVTTLGVRPGLADYQPWERDLLARAERIFYPTRRFVHALDAAGKFTFPSAASYQYRASRLSQLSLLAYLDLPVPRTRSYYGHRQKALILQDFELPLVAMSPLAVPRCEWVIATQTELWSRAALYNPVIIQEYLPLARRVRLVCINYQCLGALESPGNGGRHGPDTPVDLHHPDLEAILGATLRLLRVSRLDDIAVEWGYGNKKWWVLGMSAPPARIATLSGAIHRHRHVGQLIAAGIL